MIYLADSLRAFFEAEERSPIKETDWATPKEIRKFLKLLREANRTVNWRMFAVENCVQTERGSKEFSKILRREIVPNKTTSVKLEKGDLIIYLEFVAGKPMLHFKKVTGI